MHHLANHHVLYKLSPGCKTLKFSVLKFCLHQSNAKASPRASIIVVDVVGAIPIGRASSTTGERNLKSAAFTKVLSVFDDMLLRGY